MADDEIRGFAGFDSLVSDLSDLPAPVSKIPEPPAPKPPVPEDDDEPVRPPAAKKPEEGNTGWWIFAAVIVVSLLALYGITNRSGPIPVAPSAPNTYRPPATTAPPPPAPPREPEEVMPPVGTGLSLSASQIRYCLSQNIRIDGAKPAVDETAQMDIGAFNAMVADYNSRCSSFRYRQGLLESVRAEVEHRRQALEAQGYVNFLAITKPKPAPSAPAVKPGAAQDGPTQLSDDQMMAALYRGYPTSISVDGYNPCRQARCSIGHRKTEKWTGQDGKARQLVIGVVEQEDASHAAGAVLGIGIYRWDYLAWATEVKLPAVTFVGGWGKYRDEIRVVHFSKFDPIIMVHDNGLHQGMIDESESIIINVFDNYKRALNIETAHSTGGFCDPAEPSCIKRILSDDFSSKISLIQAGDGAIEVTQTFSSGVRTQPRSWRISTNGQVKETTRLCQRCLLASCTAPYVGLGGWRDARD